MLSEKRILEMLCLANDLPTGFKYDSTVYVLRATLKIILEMNSEEEVAWLESWAADVKREAEESDIK